MSKLRLSRKACIIILICCAALVAAYKLFLSGMLAESELMKSLIASDSYRAPILDTLVMDGFGAIVFVCMTVYMGYPVLNPLQKPIGKSLLFLLPSLAVAINNFPLIGLFSGNAYVSDPVGGVLILIAYCIAIGMFEEFAFRGLFYLMILENRRKSTKQIFWTTAVCCAVFGLVHLVNLFIGADPGATLLQVGYSFLIGGMCSIVLLKTANIWYCVLLHTVYDIGGTILYLGGGKRWDTVTVIITAVLGVAVAVFMLITLLRIKPEEVERLFPHKQSQPQAEAKNE